MGSRVIDGFTPGKTYLFQIYAVNSAGDGPLSAVVEHLIPTYSTPNAPTDVILVCNVVPWIGPKYQVEAVLTWISPTKRSDGGPIVIRQFEIELFDIDDPGDPQKVGPSKYVAGDQITCTINDTSINKAYKAHVRAICAVSEKGAWSDYATATATPTNRMPTPTGLRLTQVGTKITAKVDALSNITYPEF